MDCSKLVAIKDLKILYVTSYYKPAYVYGGPVRSMAALCEKSAQEVAELTVLTTNANRGKPLNVPLGQPVNVDGVKVFYYPLSYGGLQYFYSITQAGAIRQFVSDYDIVISETTWGYASEITRIACQSVDVPYIVPLRGQFLFTSLQQKKLKKNIYLFLRGKKIINQASALHATDEIEAREVMKLGFSPPVFCVPNGIETDQFSQMPERGKYRQLFGIPSEAIVILFLGRLHSYKQPDIAIHACQYVAAKLGKEVHLILAGPDEGNLRKKLQLLAIKLGNGDRIHYTGMLDGDKVINILADADLLMSPTSIQENFGMAALEALAAGVPLLVSEKVPVGRWAAQVNAGRVVPATVDAFCVAACDMLSDPGRMKEMGQRGRVLARERFNIDRVAQQMLAHFQAIVETGRPLEEKCWSSS